MMEAMKYRGFNPKTLGGLKKNDIKIPKVPKIKRIRAKIGKAATACRSFSIYHSPSAISGSEGHR